MCVFFILGKLRQDYANISFLLQITAAHLISQPTESHNTTKPTDQTHDEEEEEDSVSRLEILQAVKSKLSEVERMLESNLCVCVC